MGVRTASPCFAPTTAGSRPQESFSPPPSFVPFRIFKDARKDKGQDDFLGNVVLRLKVSAAVHPLLRAIPHAPVKPHGVRAGSHLQGSTNSPRIPAQSHKVMPGPSVWCPSHSNTLAQ